MSYDFWKTNPDYNYAGQRTYNTPEEEDLLAELKDLEKKENSLECDLEDVRERICEIREELGL